MEETHLIRQRAEMRHEVRDHLAALTVGPERPRAFCQRALLALEGDELLTARHRLAVVFDEFRLVVEGVHLAHRAGAENHEHVLRPRWVVRLPRGIGIRRIDVRANGRRS